ncbi:aldehyde dehydrogenase family protein [Desulfosoma caldarium]|uniref:aldehyde dehydrogenase family protein n=1 Tax=Desulfosoma caldarium TaxID=610254 RepID=UPI0014759B87|nr:aldehyde dehydrogenase family protein [Desulfosoma caldarium]
MDFAARLEKIAVLARTIEEYRERLIEYVVEDVGFSRRVAAWEIGLSVEQFRAFARTRDLLAERSPVCREDEEVALLLPYDGNTWMNTAILSIWLVGNRVRVKFSTKGSRIARLTEKMYRPVFGSEVRFDHRGGREFMEYALRHPKIPVVCIFGSDRHVLPYDRLCRLTGKKLIFEGPGNDPFIVLDGADLDRALADLMDGKYHYSGQTCVAPERVLVHESLYEEFLDSFVAATEGLHVGPPSDPEADVVPLASVLAAENIRHQLEDARRKGGRILCGGRIEGLLVYPTVVADAIEHMLGMREEIFGPVSFVAPFGFPEEALRIAKANRYGLRSTVYGDPQEAGLVGAVLRGDPYLREVPEMVFGRFGTVSVNEPCSISWRDALITKPIGGYGYSCWVWETVGSRFVLKQGPKLFSLETSLPPAGAREEARGEMGC